MNLEDKHQVTAASVSFGSSVQPHTHAYIYIYAYIHMYIYIYIFMCVYSTTPKQIE